MPEDKGHVQLIEDLKGLLREAADFEFHDFKNTKYATPKVELYRKLHKLAEKVKNGDYDQ